MPLARLHADTTSFAVSGDYQPVEGDLDAQTIAVTYGYSRDHREDLKQWMLALVTSDEGVPHFLKPLDGNASDKASLPAVVLEFACQVHTSSATSEVYVADSGLYSEAGREQAGTDVAHVVYEGANLTGRPPPAGVGDATPVHSLPRRADGTGAVERAVCAAGPTS